MVLNLTKVTRRWLASRCALSGAPRWMTAGSAVRSCSSSCCTASDLAAGSSERSESCCFVSSARCSAFHPSLFVCSALAHCSTNACTFPSSLLLTAYMSAVLPKLSTAFTSAFCSSRYLNIRALSFVTSTPLLLSVFSFTAAHAISGVIPFRSLVSRTVRSPYFSRPFTIFRPSSGGLRSTATISGTLTRRPLSEMSTPPKDALPSWIIHLSSSFVPCATVSVSGVHPSALLASAFAPRSLSSHLSISCLLFLTA
mmetsp:Transcript_24833/g.58982  ORF Transcript_24833/g.58982 Transcript_24833/m.58982 type:complete len:255 (+) Transcript_24833:83-847(+)